MNGLMQLVSVVFSAFVHARQPAQDAPELPSLDLPTAPTLPATRPGTTPLLRDDLRRDEGVRTKAYRDTVGKLTIGVGHNIDDDRHTPADAKSRWVSQGIKGPEIVRLLEEDIAHAEAELDRELPWWRDLDPVRRDAMGNLMFNMGAPVLLGFVNTLRFIRNRQWDKAADGLLASKWARQVGLRANRIAHMVRTGMR